MGRKPEWSDYKVGMTLKELGGSDISFVRKEWNLKGKNFVGQSFAQLIPTLIKESRFHPDFYKAPNWIGEFQGGIIQTNFKIYNLNYHEQPGQVRQTGEGSDDYWLPCDVCPNGELRTATNPLSDSSISESGMITAFSSMVFLNNLNSPGTFGGVAHFPMLDIVHSPTKENVKYLIKEVKAKTGLEKFFVLRSSEKGMMIVGPELIDQDHFVSFFFSSLRLNHIEVANEYWVDDRWISHSAENLVLVSGNRVNPWRFSGILRVSSLGDLKPEEPRVIAASF